MQLMKFVTRDIKDKNKILVSKMKIYLQMESEHLVTKELLSIINKRVHLTNALAYIIIRQWEIFSRRV